MKKRLLTLALLSLALVTVTSLVRAEDERDQLQDLQARIEEYKQSIAEAQGQRKTLSAAVQLLENKINLTQAEIKQTEAEINRLVNEIEALDKKIGILNVGMSDVSELLLARISEMYKRSLLPPSYLLISKSRGSFWLGFKYLQEVQLHDKSLLFAMEEAKQNFDQQKRIKKIKQDQVADLKTGLEQKTAVLGAQKADKIRLIEVTKNDEAKYQQLLSQAIAEFQAIQAVLAGKGDESKVGSVNKGEAIASIISSSSCNSSGAHLHFTVSQDGKIVNPFDYLSPGVEVKNCSGSDCGSSDGDPFNPSGNWDWPIDNPVKFSQGYGNSWAVNHISWLPYNSHNGIDIFNDSLRVKAVADGVLWRGSYTGSGGCRLRYVRLEHRDSTIETYYLHINYL